MDGLTRSDLEALRQMMLLGSARRPLAPPASLGALIAAAPNAADHALVLLALAGQHLRFERPAPGVAAETPPEAQRLHADPRPIAPALVRRALARLLEHAEKGLAATIVSAAARRLAAAGCRLHPFDLPRFMPHLKAEASRFGLAERAFLVLSEATDRSDKGDNLDDETTPDNWIDAPKARRVKFLREQRAKDAATGRALLESAFASQPAVVRAELLGAMGVGLGPDDEQFLRSLASDRADSVKAAAAALLARIPGTPDYAARLTAAAACFQRQAGVVGALLKLVGAGAAVAFVAPAGVDAREQQAAAQRLFEGLSLRDLAAETRLSPEVLLDALPEDDVVFWALHDAAAFADDAATLLMLTAWRLNAGRAYPLLHTLTRLAAACPAPISREAATALLSSARWAEAVAGYVATDAAPNVKDDGVLAITATLLPAHAMPRFVEAIAALPHGAARGARAFADFVIALEAAGRAPELNNAGG